MSEKQYRLNGYSKEITLIYRDNSATKSRIDGTVDSNHNKIMSEAAVTFMHHAEKRQLVNKKGNPVKLKYQTMKPTTLALDKNSYEPQRRDMLKSNLNATFPSHLTGVTRDKSKPLVGRLF